MKVHIEGPRHGCYKITVEYIDYDYDETCLVHDAIMDFAGKASAVTLGEELVDNGLLSKLVKEGSEIVTHS